jgi:hypothetical protein
MLSCASVILAAGSFASAGIVNSSGVILLGGPPAPNVLPGSQLASPPIVFPEFLNGVIPAGGVDVDHNGNLFALAPVSTASVVNPLLVKSAIPAGTRVDSYFFHFDPADVPAIPNFYGASVQFDTQIIGVQLFSSSDALQKPALTPYTGTLETGDAVPVFNGGPAPPYYPGGLATRGLEDDAMAIILGSTQIDLSGAAFGTEIDQVRIYVAVIPEPATSALVASACVGLCLAASRNRRRS